MKKSLKTVVATVLATAAMTITALAGSYTHSGSFTIEPGYYFEVQGSKKFDEKSNHTMDLYLEKGYAKGVGNVSIARKGIFNTYYTLASQDFEVKKANYAGVYFVLELGTVSEGTRYYCFGSDETAYYKVSSYKDNW